MHLKTYFLYGPLLAGLCSLGAPISTAEGLQILTGNPLSSLTGLPAFSLRAHNTTPLQRRSRETDLQYWDRIGRADAEASLNRAMLGGSTASRLAARAAYHTNQLAEAARGGNNIIGDVHRDALKKVAGDAREQGLTSQVSREFSGIMASPIAHPMAAEISDFGDALKAP